MHEDPDVVLGPKRSLREQREHLWIAKMRRLSCFNQIVKKFVDGQGVAIVARWCHELNPEGEFQDIALETWRKYLTALSIRVKSQSGKTKRIKTEPLAYRLVMDEVRRQQEVIADVPAPNPAGPIWSVVKKAARELDAETMLRYCFAVQLERVEALVEFERKMKLVTPRGHKEIRVLAKIASEIQKCEIGKLLVKGHKTILGGKGHSSSPPNGRTSAFAPIDELCEIPQDALRAAAEEVIKAIRERMPKRDVHVTAQI
jgi:hypothetical protein